MKNKGCRLRVIIEFDKTLNPKRIFLHPKTELFFDGWLTTFNMEVLDETALIKSTDLSAASDSFICRNYIKYPPSIYVGFKEGVKIDNHEFVVISFRHLMRHFGDRGRGRYLPMGIKKLWKATGLVSVPEDKNTLMYSKIVEINDARQ